MSKREGSQRERRATRAGGPALAPGGLSEERAQRNPAERDRTLSRIRTTTAVTGIGAVLAGGALVGWLDHGAADEANSTTSTSTSTSSSSDDSLTSPTTSTDSGSSADDSSQPGVTSGGS